MCTTYCEKFDPNIVWTFPAKESHKLNVDASRLENRNQAIGEVTRNDKGRINIVFVKSTADVNVLVAECMPICEGIEFAQNKKTKNVEVESDAFTVIRPSM